MNRGLSIVFARLPLGLALCLAGCTIQPIQPVAAAPPPPPPPVAQAQPQPASASVATTEEATYYPENPPPDPIPEVQPVSPGYSYAWVNGYWDWNGADWLWIDGYWAPQRVGYVYVQPRFEIVDGRAVYYRSYWTGPAGAREYGYGYGPHHEPPAAMRAHPTAQPAAWRNEHNEAWKKAPGAATWHGSNASPHEQPTAGNRQLQSEHPGGGSQLAMGHSQQNAEATHAPNGAGTHPDATHAPNASSAPPAGAPHPQASHGMAPARNVPPGQNPQAAKPANAQTHQAAPQDKDKKKKK